MTGPVYTEPCGCRRFYYASLLGLDMDFHIESYCPRHRRRKMPRSTWRPRPVSVTSSSVAIYGRPFWDRVRDSASGVAGGPPWLKAGITLDAAHFETYDGR